MSNPNTERDERLAKIRAARETGVLPWSHLSSPAQQFKMAAETLDYLLALLDSQADPRPHGNQHYPYCARHEGGNYNATLACTCYDYPLVAATRMRDRCVEKVKSLADAYKRKSDDQFKQEHWTSHEHFVSEYNAACEIITALESLTLEGEQEKR